MWVYNKATIKFPAAVIISGIQQHRHEFYNDTIVLVKETLSKSARFLLAYISIHGNDKYLCLLVQLVLSGLREVPVRVRCHVFGK